MTTPVISSTPSSGGTAPSWKVHNLPRFDCHRAASASRAPPLEPTATSCDPTRIRGNNEVLEGSRFPDVLIASGGGDLLIGREGNDRCVGGRHKRC